MEEENPGEMVHLEWQFVQLLVTSGSADRAAYYGVNYGPAVWFDGVDEVRGWGDDTVASYETTVAARVATGSQLMVEADVTFDETTRSGSVLVTVEVASGETIPDISSARIRCAIYENGIELLGMTFDFIGRAIVLDAPLTISASGEVQIASASFSLTDPDPPPGAWPWGPAANFAAIAFVQLDDTGEILNSALATVQPTLVQPVSWGHLKALYR